jgi:four helix bundle protein
VAEEADEAVLWLELLVESGIVPQEKVEELLTEARELTAIFTASQQTARSGAEPFNYRITRLLNSLR